MVTPEVGNADATRTRLEAGGEVVVRCRQPVRTEARDASFPLGLSAAPTTSCWLGAEDVVGDYPTSLLHPAARHTVEWKLHWLFRLALCGEFVGHGAFGLMTKQAWVPYFTLFGLPEGWAWTLMPVVGSVDIVLGLLALVAPTRAGLLYMGCWGLFTALLRPLAGEGGGSFWNGPTTSASPG
jgi:hypothetical protein